MIPAVIAGALLVLVAVSVPFVVKTGGNSKTIPDGTTIAGVAVSGDPAKAKDSLEKTIASGSMIVKDANGSPRRNANLNQMQGATFLDAHRIKYSDLGVTADVDGAIADAMKPRTIAGRLLGYGNRIPLRLAFDGSKTRTTLNSAMVQRNAVTDESISYENGSFVVRPGKSGDSVDMSKFYGDVFGSDTTTGSVKSLPVSMKTTVTTAAPASISNAGDIAARANAVVSRSYSLSYQDQSAAIPRDTVASWLRFPVASGKASISVDKAAVDKSMTDLTRPLSMAMVPNVDMMTPDGKTKIIRLEEGSDGYDVSAPDAYAQVSAAVDKASDCVVAAKVADVPAATNTKNAPGDFGSANGSPWLKIDLSSQTITAYRGTTQVKSFPTATGTDEASDLTDNGTYYVNVKYQTQTMRGPGYVSPGVQWISYFNGGEGFHAAPWNIYNITHGFPSSHGCANMYPEDAKWVYDFAPIGTKVEVVGTTPSAPVR